MKNDPTLAKQVMERVETFIAAKEATKRPNRTCSYILVLDEDGEIAHTCISSGGEYPDRRKRHSGSLR